MAFTYTGFDGTVDEVRAAIRDRFQGMVYAVGGQDDFKPSVSAALTRGVDFAPGVAYGKHVQVVSDATVSAQSDAVGSGSRWDTYVLRRNWAGAGGTATVEVIPGGSTAAVAAGARSVSLSSAEDDQLLCLARIDAGKPSVQQLIDLRTWPAPTVYSNDLRAIREPVLGQQATIVGQGDYQYLPGSPGPSWVQTHVEAGPVAIVPNTGYGVVSGYPLQIERSGRIVHVRGLMTRAAKWTAGAEYAAVIKPLPAQFRPNSQEFHPGATTSSNTAVTLIWGVDGSLIVRTGTTTPPYISIASTWMVN